MRDMFLSYETLLNLGLLANDFPSSQCGTDLQTSNTITAPSISATRSVNDGCCTATPHSVTCSYPQREAAPPRPSQLPFPCTPENNEWMRAWLLDRYASSTFNTCPHHVLPSMEDPPIDIHVDQNARPKACHTPASIPLHWQQHVYEDLLCDIALGVIKRVSYEEPVTWCQRMITRKHDGSPHCTVDLSPLNKFCQRETIAMKSPFQLVR